MRRADARSAFTIVELLVVVTIIASLVGILLPAIGQAREQAKLSISHANLRNLAAAHGSYAAEWNDRQLTFVVDNISTYGPPRVAHVNYWAQHGEDGGESTQHPGVICGWGYYARVDRYFYHVYRTGSNCSNASMTLPINMPGFSCNGDSEYHGSFRLANAEQLHQYVSGRFYDRVFYAPKDRQVGAAVERCFSSPYQCELCAEVSDAFGEILAWSSYCLSPAAMFSPEVLRHDDPDDDGFNGYADPWLLPAGFRAPSFSQCAFPALKTHMLEHHWLQNRGDASECNPGISPGTYGNPGCEPYFFNHAWESSPVTLFYDGHVGSAGVRKAMRADGRMRVQSGVDGWGLWSKDTPWGDDGYLIEYGYDQAATSFHILTTDGIRGRDLLAGGS